MPYLLWSEWRSGRLRFLECQLFPRHFVDHRLASGADASLLKTGQYAEMSAECRTKPVSTSRSTGGLDGRSGMSAQYNARLQQIFIPRRSSQSRYPEVNHWLPATGNNARRFEVFPAVFNHRRSNMMKFTSTSDEESLLTDEVSDEALEIAGGKELVGSLTWQSEYC